MISPTGTETASIEKRCSRCGAAFQCQQEAGCWCTDVFVKPETLANLRAEFSDCLCEICLRAASQGQVGPDKAQTPAAGIR